MMVLRVEKGIEVGKVYRLDIDSMRIGRDHVVEITVLDETSSRKHAEVFRVGEMYFVKDLGSRNGTVVNDEKIEEELLRVGDRILVGNTVLVFEDESMSDAHEVEFSDEGGIDTTRAIDLKKMGLVAKGTTERFSVLYDIARTISSERDKAALLDKVAEEVHKALLADETYVFVQEEKKLQPVAVKKTKGGETVSGSIIRSVLHSGRAVLTSDASADHRFKESDSIVMKAIHSVVCAPLISMEQTKGVIYAARRSLTERFSEDDLELLSATAMMTGVAMQGLEIVRDHRRTLMQTMKTLVAATELRDPSAKGHSERVSAICRVVAVEMMLKRRDVMRAELAGLLHDIGKVAVSDYSLHSVGQATERAKGGEQAHHVMLGEQILSSMKELSDVAEAVKTHHEAFDGSGFPEGLSGKAIPVMGRIISVANGFDHLLTRGGSMGDSTSVKDALVRIGKMSGKKYDPDVVKSLLVAYRNGALFSDMKEQGAK